MPGCIEHKKLLRRSIDYDVSLDCRLAQSGNNVRITNNVLLRQKDSAVALLERQNARCSQWTLCQAN